MKPTEIKVVIIGQDPYPTLGNAQGLSFSVPKGRAIPGSLRNIINALINSNLYTSPDVIYGDLRSWASQGVLLLNTSLTTRIDCCRAHTLVWKNFIKKFLDNFCSFRSNLINGITNRSLPLHFLLWGKDARNFAPLILSNNQHIVHEWTHPSNLADSRCTIPKKFKNCPHFIEVNDDLRSKGFGEINWNPLSRAVGFTDGACINNGRKNARASFAAIITGVKFNGMAKPTVIRGILEPFQYNFVDLTNPMRGFKPTFTSVTPTNNRAELLAICWCLFAMLKTGLRGKLHLVSDSKLSIKTLQKWLPARRQEGTETDLKNLDLIHIADCLYQELLQQAYSVDLHHVHSHQHAPGEARSVWERLLYQGNAKADEYATLLLTNKQYDEKFQKFGSISALNVPSVLENFLDSSLTK